MAVAARTSRLAASSMPDLVRLAESARVQATGVAIATLCIGAWHWQNDGLWLQGDAPRHALTGLFFWDLLTAFPADPLGYTLSYFARYPALVVGAYPPLFHLVEALAFGVTGPSPYVAKVLVLGAASIVGFYTMAWGRRWISPVAGWAGACAVLLPWMVQNANAVLLNVPATAAGLAALYHCQAWLDAADSRDRTRCLIWAGVAVGLYLPGGIIIPVAVAWLATAPGRWNSRVVWVPAACLATLVAVVALALPQYLAKHGPSLGRLVDSANWRYYANAVPRGVGGVWMVLAAIGLVVAAAPPSDRWSARRLGLGLVAVLATLTLLPARDQRYALVLGPMIVLLGFHAVSRALDALSAWRVALTPAVVAALLVSTGAAAWATPVRRISGIDDVVRYLRAHGQADSVLYSGVYDGVFTFYVRAMDPRYERRVVLAHRLLSDLRQAADFTWQESTIVTSQAEVVDLVRRQCGCRWVVIETASPWVTGGERLLREAVTGTDFEHVHAFAVEAPPGRRVDVYRLRGDVTEVAPRDLAFPSYTTRVFRAVRPIPTRP